MPSLKLLVPTMVLLGAILADGSGPLRAQGPDAAATLLEDAIRKQRIDGDLAGAIAGFEAVLARFGSQRGLASETLWRMAQSQEQLGRFDDARRSYEQLLSEYPDNVALTNATRARLAALAEDEAWTNPEFSPEITVVDEWAPSSEAPSGCCQQFSVFSDLSIHFRTTGETHRLMTAARSAAYPVVSPDRRRVAFLSWNGDLQENAERRMAGTAPRQQGIELRVTSIDGTEDRVVLQGPSLRWLRPFEWSPDGRSVLTLIERTSGVRQVALIQVADGSVSVLKALPWLSAREMAFSADGRFAAYESSAPRSATQFEFYVLPTSVEPGSTPERRYALSLVGQRQTRVADADLAVHVLNRFGFGPRRGDIERVLAMGIDPYIDQQLYPERIEDPVVDRMIAGFTSLRMSVEELLEKAGPAHPIAERRRASIFERPGIIARARAHGGSGLPGMAAGGPPDGLDDRPRDLEAHGARMIRAIHGQRQLQEVLVDFWMNHFSLNHQGGDDQLIPSFEEQIIRRYALGRFEDLLEAVATHPRMLSYLDNWRSSAPAEVIAERLAGLKKSADAEQKVALLEREVFLKETKGINENYARELLELHTMGVDSGYTQQDIQEVARILTGWTIRTSGVVNGRDEDGVFMFDPLMHVEGDKVVLGQMFRSGGIDEGEALLTMLAHRPETARFIATKLARRFIADDPPASVIAAASRTFLDTRGDIREVVRTILMSPEFRSSEALRVKIKKPFELVVSALRAVDATFEDPDTYLSFSGNRSFISRMGEQMYNHEAPDGNPDIGAEWMNANALLVRLEFAHRLATGRLTGITPDLASADALLTEIGVPRPTPLQIEQTRTMMAATSEPTTSAPDDAMAMRGASAGPAGEGATADPATIAVAAMLGSPQFQKR